MLVNIHLQKYNRYKFLESYLYCNDGVWNLAKEHLQQKVKTFQMETVCKGTMKRLP